MKRMMLVMMLVLATSVNAETYKETINFDATIGVFAENFCDENHVNGYWAVGTIFPSNKESFGLVVERSGWSGETGDGYMYNGNRQVFGLAFRSAGTNSQTELRFGYGGRRDDGRKAESTGAYESVQYTGIVSTYLASETSEIKKWFGRKKITWTGDFDISHERDDSWTDIWGAKEIGTAPENQSMVKVEINTEVLTLNDRNIIIGGGISSIYNFEKGNFGIRPEIGLYLWDRAVEVNGHCMDWSKSANSYGGGATANISNLFKKLEKKKEVINLDDMDTTKDVLMGN